MLIFIARLKTRNRIITHKHTQCSSKFKELSQSAISVFLFHVLIESVGQYHPALIFFFFCFLVLYPLHMEVPGLGVESEIQLLAYTIATAMQDLSYVCDLHHSSRQCHILNTLSEGSDQTLVLMDTSWVH